MKKSITKGMKKVVVAAAFAGMLVVPATVHAAVNSSYDISYCSDGSEYTFMCKSYLAKTTGYAYTKAYKIMPDGSRSYGVCCTLDATYRYEETNTYEGENINSWRYGTGNITTYFSAPSPKNGISYESISVHSSHSADTIDGVMTSETQDTSPY